MGCSPSVSMPYFSNLIRCVFILVAFIPNIAQKIDVHSQLQFYSPQSDQITIEQNVVISTSENSSLIVLNHPFSDGVWKCKMEFHSNSPKRRLVISSTFFNNIFK